MFQMGRCNVQYLRNVWILLRKKKRICYVFKDHMSDHMVEFTDKLPLIRYHNKAFEYAHRQLKNGTVLCIER
jgi:hypothetical protein